MCLSAQLASAAGSSLLLKQSQAHRCCSDNTDSCMSAGARVLPSCSWMEGAHSCASSQAAEQGHCLGTAPSLKHCIAQLHLHGRSAAVIRPISIHLHMPAPGS